jgi:hypothetical protein
VTVAELAAQWRQKAADMDRTAKSYARACVKDRAVQIILLAKQIRALADEMEKELK